ncbi:MAG: HIT domain-containing protein [Melioribacteraceae bacterium]|jgi:ATP adenylyltransferase|nr:HIT domain-containing protein [Melioribacteraceae bacterium]
MEKMWSPWRSQYIDAFKEKKLDDGCVFCNAVRENMENSNSLVIQKGKDVFTIMNLYPYNNGHLLVVPDRHISAINQITTEEFAEITKQISFATDALTKLYAPHGFNIGANIGKAAGAGIDKHIHFHIIPRWNGDTNFMPVVGEVKIISHDLLKTRNDLRNIYKEFE